MGKVFFVLFLFSALWVFAEDKDDKDYSIIPMATYEFISLENQQYHVPGGGLVFLKVSGGYIFNSRERYDNNPAQSLGNGYFINLQLAWQF